VRDTAAFRALAPLLADSSKVVKSPYSPDATERYLPGSEYPQPCVRRIEEDRAGFTLIAPLLYRDWGTNVYARDMHERNLALIRQYPGRAVYLMRPPTSETGALPQLYPLRADSIAVAGPGLD
jgi:hypothetical protein